MNEENIKVIGYIIRRQENISINTQKVQQKQEKLEQMVENINIQIQVLEKHK